MTEAPATRPEPVAGRRRAGRSGTWLTGLLASLLEPRSDGTLPPESLYGAAKIWEWPQIAAGAPSLKMVYAYAG